MSGTLSTFPGAPSDIAAQRAALFNNASMEDAA